MIKAVMTMMTRLLLMMTTIKAVMMIEFVVLVDGDLPRLLTLFVLTADANIHHDHF